MADLTIYGAGIFGLSLAWEALKRGAAVTVIDPNGPGAGASGGLVGALQPHMPDPWNEKKQFQFDSLVIARTFWSDVEKLSGLSSGFAPVGRLHPLATERDVELARARTPAAARNWRGLASWSVTDKPPDHGAWCPPSPTGLYLYDTLSAILNPRRATESLAAAVKARGGTITAEANPKGPVIWATGWDGLRDLSRKFGKPVGNGVKGQALLVDHTAIGAPQVYADGLHIIAHLDGTVAIGSTSEREFEAPFETDAQLDALHARAIAQLPALADAPILRCWAGVRPRAQSRAPLIGPWPGRPGHFIANGGFKIGFGMAPKCAETLLDLVFEDTDQIPDSFHTRYIV
ncbi:MAG: FAD-binding oxidoreductase [Pseudomonadota bacterium]